MELCPLDEFCFAGLSGTGDMKFEANASKALAWLIRTQNEEGSWNFGSCQPGASMLSGPPTFVRTCEALQGIIAATVLKVSVEGMERSIAKAVEWIRTQEKPIFDSDRNIKGWGWESSTSHYEDTCFTVETRLEWFRCTCGRWAWFPESIWLYEQCPRQSIAPCRRELPSRHYRQC